MRTIASIQSMCILGLISAFVNAVEPATSPQPVVIKDLGIKLVPIKAGKFRMGSETGEDNEKPVHEVTLSNDFWMGATEVTLAQYAKIMGWELDYEERTRERHPKGDVFWHEAVVFCQKLTARERQAKRLKEGLEYRLPTEAEWEYCCRAGSATTFGFGDNAKDLDEYAWTASNSFNEGVRAVRLKKPNAWGLYDMHGNVAEWCLDRMRTYTDKPQVDPLGKGPDARHAARGGCPDSALEECTSSYRVLPPPGTRAHIFGFRIVLAKPIPLNTWNGVGWMKDPGPGKRWLSLREFPTAKGVDSELKPKIDALIKQLGADSLEARNKATAELKKAEPSISAYLASFSTHEEPEIRSRTNEIAEFLHARLALKVPDIELTMVPIKPGRFIMGAGNPKIAHEVTLTRGFWISQTEITQLQLRGGRKPKYPDKETVAGYHLPAVSQSDYDALSFCAGLTAKEWEAGRLPLTLVYRLPTEAEWEYCCRAGNQESSAFGTQASDLGDYGWYKENSGGEFHPVGKKKPNAWGLYDMHGNAYEICVGGDRSLIPEPAVDPVDYGFGSTVRGGDAFTPAQECRKFTRIYSKKSRIRGFRIVLGHALKKPRPNMR